MPVPSGACRSGRSSPLTAPSPCLLPRAGFAVKPRRSSSGIWAPVSSRCVRTPPALLLACNSPRASSMAVDSVGVCALTEPSSTA
eukprot:5083803-Alexandrium_andersonii.AAC.1